MFSESEVSGEGARLLRLCAGLGVIAKLELTQLYHMLPQCTYHFVDSLHFANYVTWIHSACQMADEQESKWLPFREEGTRDEVLSW